jgi:hypothetical protein
MQLHQPAGARVLPARLPLLMLIPDHGRSSPFRPTRTKAFFDAEPSSSADPSARRSPHRGLCQAGVIAVIPAIPEHAGR